MYVWDSTAVVSDSENRTPRIPLKANSFMEVMVFLLRRIETAWRKLS